MRKTPSLKKGRLPKQIPKKKKTGICLFFSSGRPHDEREDNLYVADELLNRKVGLLDGKEEK